MPAASQLHSGLQERFSMADFLIKLTSSLRSSRPGRTRVFLCETERDLCNCVRFSPCAVREYVCVFSLCVCVSLEGALRCVCVSLCLQGRGSGFPGRRRPRGAGLSGRGGRGRARGKNGASPTVNPGVGYVTNTNQPDHFS